MIEIQRRRRIKASAQELFALLADPAILGTLMPRVQSIEVLERSTDQARIATTMAFGPFGSVRNEGIARWQTDREVTFISRSPILVETRWSLTPGADDTEVVVQLRLDLAPMLGPLAGFVPTAQVQAMVAPELDAALVGLAQRSETQP